MAATPTFLLITLPSYDPSPKASLFHITMLSFFNFFLFLTFFILFLTLYSLLKNNNNVNGNKKEEEPIKVQSSPVNDGDNTVQEQKHETSSRPDPENVVRSLLLEILPPNSPNWDTLLSKGEDFDDDRDEITGSGQEEKKKKKKRAKKKKPGPNEEERKEKEELVSVYPFTNKPPSAMQRKIKQQYDQLVKSNASNGLTLAQTVKVGQFVHCLVEAKDELLQKCEVVKRKFTIAKALLHKADRSSFDRVRQQIYKLELEKQRLEEDVSVYNLLQKQLKCCPGYKRMMEIGEMDFEVKPSNPVEDTDDDFGDISFEELLEQEKKDAFWQKNGRLNK
ncbi:hypothetical protein ACJIZ3_020475 [Penstemon smallii]|uniref:Uncharacterized protein n=1 Tax=Penstemon smallii TaxID=265156 RepID=A0ABD3SJ84_9LAMI